MKPPIERHYVRYVPIVANGLGYLTLLQTLQGGGETFLGGQAKPNERLLDALLREAREEGSTNKLRLLRAQRKFKLRWGPGDQYQDTYYLALPARIPFELYPSSRDEEVLSMKWVKLLHIARGDLDNVFDNTIRAAQITLAMLGINWRTGISFPL